MKMTLLDNKYHTVPTMTSEIIIPTIDQYVDEHGDWVGSDNELFLDDDLVPFKDYANHDHSNDENNRSNPIVIPVPDEEEEIQFDDDDEIIDLPMTPRDENEVEALFSYVPTVDNDKTDEDYVPPASARCSSPISIPMTPTDSDNSQDTTCYDSDAPAKRKRSEKSERSHTNRKRGKSAKFAIQAPIFWKTKSKYTPEVVMMTPLKVKTYRETGETSVSRVTHFHKRDMVGALTAWLLYVMKPTKYSVPDMDRASVHFMFIQADNGEPAYSRVSTVDIYTYLREATDLVRAENVYKACPAKNYEQFFNMIRDGAEIAGENTESLNTLFGVKLTGSHVLSRICEAILQEALE